jgi:hypothetical protein
VKPKWPLCSRVHPNPPHQADNYHAIILFTLDTSIVCAADHRQTSHDLESIDRLIELGHQGVITLQLAEAYERDFSRYTGDERRYQRLVWLQTNPVLEYRASGAFRLDVSSLGGNDALIGSKEASLDRDLLASLRAKGNPIAKAYSDIDHLLAHQMSGADAFVTEDEKTILKRRDVLATLNVVVLTPAEALAKVTTRFEVQWAENPDGNQ